VTKYITTIGVDYGVKKMTLRNKQIAINFFDLSGDEVYYDIVKEFFRDSQGVILVVDVTNRSSF
jgi:DnaJ family protein C protein 27